MTTAAQSQVKFAALAEDFGLELFKRKSGLAGVELLAEIPRYVRGPKAGKPKGFITWIKTVRGGYDYVYGGGVRRPGESYGYKYAEDFDDAIRYSDRCVRLSTNDEQLTRARLHLAKITRSVEESAATVESWGETIARRSEGSSIHLADMIRLKAEAMRYLEREKAEQAEQAQWVADLEAYGVAQDANN